MKPTETYTYQIRRPNDRHFIGEVKIKPTGNNSYEMRQLHFTSDAFLKEKNDVLLKDKGNLHSVEFGESQIYNFVKYFSSAKNKVVLNKIDRNSLADQYGLETTWDSKTDLDKMHIKLMLQPYDSLLCLLNILMVRLARLQAYLFIFII